MEKEFVPRQEAFELKELGFDEPCLYYSYGSEHIEPPIIRDGEPQWMNHNDSIFSTCYSRPLYQQAFRWFRNKYQASPSIHCMSEQGNSWRYHIPNEGGESNFNTFEEAELACLRKLIKIVKEK